MYIVVQVDNFSGLNVGQMSVHDDWDEAVERVVSLAKEQCDVLENEIREEVESDASFLDPNGEWLISIGQPEG